MSPDLAELLEQNERAADEERRRCEHPRDQREYDRSGGYCPEAYCKLCKRWVLSGRRVSWL